MPDEPPPYDPARPHFDPALEGLRGVAILWVIWGHNTILSSTTPVDRVFHHAAGLGWALVDLFFVLCAFLVTRILLATRGMPGAATNYFVRRSVRVFPFYYAIVIFSLIILPLIPNSKAANFGKITGDEIYYWLHLENLSIVKHGNYRHGILDNGWSLPIEIHAFLILVPLLIFLLSERYLRRACLVLFLTGLTCRITLFVDGERLLSFLFGTASRSSDATQHPWSNYLSFFMLTPCRLDSVAVGMYIAILLRDGIDIRSLAKSAKWLALATGPAALALTIIEEWLPTKHPHTGPGLGRAFGTVGYSLLGVFNGSIIVLVLAAPARSILRRALCSPLLRLFGRLSYGLYMIHMPIRGLVRETLLGPPGYAAKVSFPTLLGSQLPGQFLFYLLTVPAALGVAWISFICLERPFLLLRQKFPSFATEHDWLIDPPARKA